MKMKYKLFGKCIVVMTGVFFLLSLLAYSPSMAVAAKPVKAKKENKGPKVNAGFEFGKMGDMSDFDPNNPIVPTGETIKIAVIGSHSGPAGLAGQMYWLCANWAAHDINKRGGIMVDGRKKKIELIKGDHMSKPDQCKKMVEKLITQDKVQFLWGSNQSNMMKIVNETASKYKVISANAIALTDDLQDATNFGRYNFMSSPSVSQVSAALAYYYGQKKKEKKFFILCQDYLFGREMADGFKKGLKNHYPEAIIVGEDYHKLFLTDFAPYLEKIKASGAEVIYTADWIPDSSNLLKQMRQMGITLPVANVFLDEPAFLNEMGVEGTKGLVNVSIYIDKGPIFKTPDQIKYYQLWHNQWKKWKAPYDTQLFEHAWTGNLGSYTQNMYWLLSVIERAKSTDPEKIIKIWEGDVFRYQNGKIAKMRACDHKVVQDVAVFEFVPPDQQKAAFNAPPYYWYKTSSSYGEGFPVPASMVPPWMDETLDRCKGKDISGN